MEAEIFVPDEFYCPITGELMNDPVEDIYGHSYEKESIHEWLSKSNTSPITRGPLSMSDLSENSTLKRSIESIREKLRADQLKIDARIQEEELKPFIDKLNDISVNPYCYNDKLFVSIKTPDIEVRPPIDVVLCIDISASMKQEATLKSDSNERMSDGFSILSLTISATKTVLHSLNENDNISIVTYSDRAKVLVEHTSCTPENKSLIECQLDDIRALSSTNMWDGIHQSLDILRTRSSPCRTKGILLLTDGIPNIDPPRGYLNTLEKYFRDHDFKCMISCYGFGYQLNSELLLEISNISGGDGFSFIPDASLLGNVFIHGISNMLTTASAYPKLSIQFSKGITDKNGKTGVEVVLNSLKYGSEKNLMFELDTSGGSPSRDTDCVDIRLDVGEYEIRTNKLLPIPGYYYHEQLMRLRSIDMINHCSRKVKYQEKSFISEIQEFCEEMKREADSKYIQNLCFDMDGQVKEALNMTNKGEREDWFSRWGIHYLRSLQNAYQNEVCNNFKDKGVTNFATGIFIKIRDSVSDIFDGLPPPKKDITQRRTSYRSRGREASPESSPPVQMSSYNSQIGPCCAEGSKILRSDLTYCNVEDIKKGDKIVTSTVQLGFVNSEIECVIETQCDNDECSLVRLKGLRITPYHPVIRWKEYEKHWVFPISHGRPERMKCKRIYSFVVKNRKPVIINSHIFATFGHNLRGDVIEHDYYGTDRVIDDLKLIDGYKEGKVCLTGDMVQRGEDGLVNGIR